MHYGKKLFIFTFISFLAVSCSSNTFSSNVSSYKSINSSYVSSISSCSLISSSSGDSSSFASVVSKESSIARSSKAPIDPTFTDYDNNKIIKGFCSNTIGNEIRFKFYISKYFPTYAYTVLSIKGNDYNKSIYLQKGTNEYLFNDGFPGEVYTFTFSPYYDQNTKGQDYVCTRMVPSNSFASTLPIVNISSDFGLWPDTDYVNAPTGCWGSSITNNDYVKTSIQVTSKDGEVLKDYTGARFKIRGNTSAYADRKGYKIKLESKDDMLKGLLPGDRNEKKYADKEWQLLNKARSIKQTVGFEVMRELGATYVPDSVYVNLFVNGDYRGVYLLMETIKDGNGSGEKQSRVPIDDDGFLIEDDAYWWNEPLNFDTPLTKDSPMRYTFKYPDPEDITEKSDSYTYIKNYYTDFEKSLISTSPTNYLSYINQSSFAIWILGQDIMCNEDGGGANIYVYKKDQSSSRLEMGPGWDYDACLNNVTAFSNSRYNPYFVYQHLLKKQSFIEEYEQLFNTIKESLVKNVMERVSLKTINNQEAYNWDDIRYSSGESLHYQIENVTTYLNSHLKWLVNNI